MSTSVSITAKTITTTVSSSSSPSPSSSSPSPTSTMLLNNNKEQQLNSHSSSHSKSPPVLVKYNYYDAFGVRCESQLTQYQQHLGSNSNSNNYNYNNNNVNTQQQLANNNADQATNACYLINQLARRYKQSSYENHCLRCKKTVYQMDKLGPLKDFTFYHQNCFKCLLCGTKLTLKTYFNNQQQNDDREVYCHNHCPKTNAAKLDNQTVGIRLALDAPKVFEFPTNIVNNGQQQQLLTSSPTTILTITNSNNNNNNNINNGNNCVNGNEFIQCKPSVDSSALHIKHAIQQTKLQHIYSKSQVDKKLSAMLEKRLEYLRPKQEKLEMLHRREEDALFEAFKARLMVEEELISKQIRDEWQAGVANLIQKYKSELTNNLSKLKITNNKELDNYTKGNNSNSMKSESKEKEEEEEEDKEDEVDDERRMRRRSRRRRSEASNNSFNNVDINNHHQLKTNNELLNNDSNQAISSTTTTTLTDINSKQNFNLVEVEKRNLEKSLTLKLDKKKETLKRKLKLFEQQATAELIEKQSKEMLALISAKLDEFRDEQKPKSVDCKQQLLNEINVNDAPPPPRAPKISKLELYNGSDADDVFAHIDERAINVAQEDTRSFTDLVHHLTRDCVTDVEKVRAIFRWITVKNLNKMHFDTNLAPDTPLGLLRGIKNGSESYHVLFKRLCSYAGLHCVVIKGYSKSAGYQPGVKLDRNGFKNNWNAVFVAGAWRFVQCNWGARHLVSVSTMHDKNQLVKANESTAKPSHAEHQHRQLEQPNYGRRGNNHHQNKHLVASQLNKLHSSSSSSTTSSSSQIVASANQRNLQPLDVVDSRSGGESLSNLHRRMQSLSSASSTVSSSSSSTSSSKSHSHNHKTRSSTTVTTQSIPSTPSRSANFFPTTQSSFYNTTIQQQQQQQQASRTTNVNLTPTTNAQKLQTQQQLLLQQSSDNLRYEYDDHYFLTDPAEFIYEFFPHSPEWQLLKTRPITLSEFEELPFVRSLFFKYGLYFPQPNIRSTLYTDSSGAVSIKIGMPTHMIPSLIFHYNLRYYDSEVETYDGVSLKRFVMQSVESGDGSNLSSPSPSPNSTTTTNNNNGGNNNKLTQKDEILQSNIVSFRVHLPENGSYILDIFANSTTPMQYINGEPMKFKSVCKFKIVSKNLKTVMIPLPNCTSGEFGPLKATRLFGLIPITHENGLICFQRNACATNVSKLEIQFRMTRPLTDFMASLHKNNCDEKRLSNLINIYTDGTIVSITVKFIDDGQYGLDLYTRDCRIVATSSNSSTDLLENNHDCQSRGHKKQLLTHCCKYLINVRS